MGSLGGKVALVTGASVGIGAETVRLLAEQGADVVIHWYENESDAEALAAYCKGLGRRVALVYADLSGSEGVNTLLFEASKLSDSIEILVNNACFPSDGDFPYEYDTWDRTMSVNLRAIAHLCKSLLTTMSPGSSIINITSIQAMFAGELSWAYGASKSALEQLTKRLAVEGGPRGIRVNSIRPGLILGERNLQRWTLEESERLSLVSKVYPLKRVGVPHDVATVCAFLASDDSGFITGASIPVDGGLSITNAALAVWALRNEIAGSA